jgi:hypothetical protein
MELCSRVLKGHRQNKLFRWLEIVESYSDHVVVGVAFPFSAPQLLDILHGDGTDRYGSHCRCVERRYGSV